MSIKLYNVPGSKLETDEENTQDLLLITDDTFISTDGPTYGLIDYISDDQQN